MRLGELAASVRAESAGAVTRKALQRALELNRVQFTQRLLELPGANACLERIDVVRLYASALSKSRFLSSSKLGETLAEIDISGDETGPTAPAPAHAPAAPLSFALGGSFSAKARPMESQSFRRMPTTRRSSTRTRGLVAAGVMVLSSATALRRYQRLATFFQSISPQVGARLPRTRNLAAEDPVPLPPPRFSVQPCGVWCVRDPSTQPLMQPRSITLADSIMWLLLLPLRASHVSFCSCCAACGCGLV